MGSWHEEPLSGQDRGVSAAKDFIWLRNTGTANLDIGGARNHLRPNEFAGIPGRPMSDNRVYLYDRYLAILEEGAEPLPQ